ncbi:sigma-70 family RNA polymerase sigma factor [Cytobacillus eiseniae]|nr:sigma-70 family RNA polymerase sigma factor [Cytobacillus eiseniae]
MVSSRSLIANKKAQKEGCNEWNELYPRLRRYCHFLAKNKWDADDLVQQSFLKAILHYQSSDVNPALLNKIAYHQWIDTIRKRKQEIVGIIEEEAGKLAVIDSDRLLDTVAHLLKNVTPKQAIVFLLKEAFSYQAKEIAELLDTSEMAVKSLIHRTRKRLEKETQLQSIDSFWCEEERELLCNLIHQSLHAEDPAVLIDYLTELPSLAEVPKNAKQTYSNSPLNLYSMAA